MIDLLIGTGPQATPGTTASIHYVGRLANGRVFDSSREAGKPIDFVLGRQMVIPGWEQGVRGMRVGGKRSLVVPPELAYGPHGRDATVPPNATLLFEIELVAVR